LISDLPDRLVKLRRQNQQSDVDQGNGGLSVVPERQTTLSRHSVAFHAGYDASGLGIGIKALSITHHFCFFAQVLASRQAFADTVAALFASPAA